MCVWSFPCFNARKGDWQQVAADRMRFERKIKQIEKILSPILSESHREKIAVKLNLENKKIKKQNKNQIVM